MTERVTLYFIFNIKSGNLFVTFWEEAGDNSDEKDENEENDTTIDKENNGICGGKYQL